VNVKVAVIGVGKMGKHHARVISRIEGAELTCVADASLAAAEAVARQRDCKAVTDSEEAAELADCGIVATPTSSHLEAATPFIESGKPVLIEKPFTTDITKGQAFLKKAEEKKVAIQIGHTERYNPASLAVGKYGIHPKFIEAHRISPYTFRSADIGVVMDIMIHDLDLILMYAGSNVVSEVRAVGVNVIGDTEDICNVRLEFDNGCVANITASRLAIKTERKMRIFSETHYLSVDFAAQVGVVIEKDKNLDMIKMAREMDVDDIAELAQSVDYREMLMVEELNPVNSADPLTMQATDFLKVVRGEISPPCSAKEGLEAVKLAQRIVETMRQHRWDGKHTERTGPDIIDKD